MFIVYMYLYIYICFNLASAFVKCYDSSPSCCPRTYALTLLEEFQGLRVVLDTVATTVMSALGRSAKWQPALLVTEEEAQPLDVTLGIQVMDDRFGIETHGDLETHHFKKPGNVVAMKIICRSIPGFLPKN